MRLTLMLLGLWLPVPAEAAGDAGKAMAMAADTICGEAGRDEKLSNLVAGTIANRMALEKGGRARKLLAVLTAPRQYVGSCLRNGRKPTEWHRHLARTLLERRLGSIPLPAWFTPKTRWFSTARGRPAPWRRGVRKVGRYLGVDFFEKR